MKNIKIIVLIFVVLTGLSLNVLSICPSKAVNDIITDTRTVTLEDHDWASSEYYYLFNGDQIGIQLIVTGAIDPDSDITVYLETPIGDFLIGYYDYNDGYVIYHWTVLTHFGDVEGNHRIKVTNEGLVAGGDDIIVDITFWTFTNTLSQGNILTPSEGERVEGTTTLTWNFQDADVNDILKYCIHYRTGITTDPSETFQFLDSTYDSSFEWDTTQHVDGLCTIRLMVKEWDATENYYAFNFHFVHLRIDNDNDPPSITILSPETGNEYSSEITIKYSGIDSNEDDLTYSLYYASDGTTFDNEIAIDIDESSYTWNVSTIADGKDYRIKATVKDEHGITMDSVTGKFTINNPEYINWLTPNDIVHDLLQTVKIDTNAHSVELFVNGLSKGTQTEGFEWTVLLSEGSNELNAKVEDNLGTKTTFTKFVTYQNETTTTTTEEQTDTADFISVSIVIIALMIFYQKRKSHL